MDKDVQKQKDRLRKRSMLIFKTLKKGKIKIEPEMGRSFVFRYEIEQTYPQTFVNYKNGEVECMLTSQYDNVEITNEDGSEVDRLPLWMVAMIEQGIKDKFESFNIELVFRKDSSGQGKNNVLKENEFGYSK